MDDYQGSIHWHIRLKEVNDFADIDSIVPRIRKLMESSQYDHLTEREKIALKTFIDTVDGKAEKLV